MGYGQAVDYGNPIAPHPLNRARLVWLYGLPNWAGGRTWHDLCRRAPASLVNGPAWTPSPAGAAVGMVAASSQYASCGNLSRYDGGAAATFAVWIRRSAPPASVSESGIAGVGYTNFSGNSHYPNTNGLVYFGLFNPANNSTRAINGYSDAGFDKSVWHRLVITQEPGVGGYRMYRNGLLVTTGTGYSTAGFGTVQFGQSTLNGYYLLGALADACLWTRALSAAEVWVDYDQSRRGYPDVLRRTPPRAAAVVAGAGGNRRRRVLICGGR